MQQVAENDESVLDDELAELFKELTEMNEAENDFTVWNILILIIKFSASYQFRDGRLKSCVNSRVF